MVGIQLLGLSVEVTSTLDAFLRRLLQGVRERVVPPARQFQPVGARISFAVAVASAWGCSQRTRAYKPRSGAAGKSQLPALKQKPWSIITVL